MTDTAYSHISPGLQFLYFLLVTLVAIAVGYLIGGGIITLFYGTSTLTDLSQLNLSNPNTVRALWILQMVSTTIPLLVAPLFFAHFIVKEQGSYLKINKPFPFQLLLIIFFLMFVSLPIIEQLSNINQLLTLPHWLKGVEDWVRDSEKRAEQLTNVILKMNTIWDLIKTLLLVGALTAIVEELMFRGVLQTIFLRWTKNHHAAIWITATLFSAFHMEFFGFLPRLMLGVFFGYFVYWSDSIWPSIWAHFVNNGTAVIATYLYQHKTVKLNPGDTHVFSLPGYIFSIIITVLLLLNYRNIAQPAKIKALNGEELD